MAGKPHGKRSGQAAVFAACLGLAVVLQAGPPGLSLPGSAQAQEVAPTLPERNEIARPLWSTLIAVDQANRTGNYTVLRDLGAPGFRDANTAAQQAAIFQPTRDAGLNLGATILRTPAFTGGEWRLVGLSIRPETDAETSPAP